MRDLHHRPTIIVVAFEARTHPAIMREEEEEEEEEEEVVVTQQRRRVERLR